MTLYYGKDIRTVECYLETGQYVGVLEVQARQWMHTAHSLETRQAVNRLIHVGEMHVPFGGDPIVVFMEHLEKKAVDGASKNRVSQDASELADHLRISGAKSPPKNAPRKAANEPQIRSLAIQGVRLPKEWQ